MTDKILEVRGLTKTYGGEKLKGDKKATPTLDVLKGIDIDIYRGDVVCLIGPSGCGKSTFLRCLNRLEIPASGSIKFEGTEVDEAHIDAVRQKMGMVFQHFNLFPHLTVKKKDVYKRQVLQRIHCAVLHLEGLGKMFDLDHRNCSLLLNKLLQSNPCGFASSPGGGAFSVLLQRQSLPLRGRWHRISDDGRSLSSPANNKIPAVQLHSGDYLRYDVIRHDQTAWSGRCGR